MKCRISLFLILAVAGLGLESASGQVYSPPSAPRAPRPTLSPYLNLLDRNNSAAFNYFNQVRPRQAFADYRRREIQTLGKLNRRIEQNTEDLLQQSENSQLQPTGHHTRFLDLGGYFGGGAGRGRR